jgi:hypothetical protein
MEQPVPRINNNVLGKALVLNREHIFPEPTEKSSGPAYSPGLPMAQEPENVEGTTRPFHKGPRDQGSFVCCMGVNGPSPAHTTAKIHDDMRGTLAPAHKPLYKSNKFM